MFVNVAINDEIDGEAFILMSVDGIVSMVSSKGAQLKLAEKKRQLFIIYPVVMTDSTTVTKVGICSYIYTCNKSSEAHFVMSQKRYCFYLNTCRSSNEHIEKQAFL